MLCEWACAKSSTSLDDKLVHEIRSKLEADGKLQCGCLIVTLRTFLVALGGFMADMITPNFSRSELTCRCGCGSDEIDFEFMRMLQELLNEVGPMPVSSAFRCDTHNNKVSKVKNDPHTKVKASDILISGERTMLLFEKARKIGFSGIGLSQKAPHHKRFIHVDTLDRKALWSY